MSKNRTSTGSLIFTLLILLLYPGIAAFGQNAFDGEVREVLTLQEPVFETQNLSLRIGQLLLINQLPEHSQLSEGMEIILSPPNTGSSGSSFAVYVFRQVRARLPEHSTDSSMIGQSGSYQGERILFEPLPGRSTFSVRIPFLAEHSVRGGIDSRVTSPVSNDSTAVAITILPIMKGLPDYLLNAPFSITVKPILTQVGGLNVAVRSHTEQTVSADELQAMGLTVELDRFGSIEADETVYIRPGIYQVLIKRQGVLYASSQVAVERGIVQSSVINLPKPESQIKFEIPDSVRIRVNDRDIDNRSISVPPGNYVIELELDSFRSRQELAVQAGREYTVQFSLGINFSSKEASEEPEQQP
ncbi:MAG: hypothetical protein D6B26_02530 [Spirochaetaceae bacterium]|nr:MAG: hypothetical protein D6B26_02530 [Spirochaetaceae bacterium]